MKKIFFLFFINILYQAQTGIGTTSPNASAKLEVYATNKGFLPPRVTLTSTTDAATIANPAEGLLVYNLGSVGLQAGYYFWNGANWATIATTSTVGNGVTSSDLVKLYQEAYSTTSGKASSTSGYSFTVAISGRYEFNFNCTGWNSNGGTVKLTFNVRNGTTILASDYHQSTSSNIWAEYEGRFEVNLNAGETYNVQVVTTSGSRDYRDYDKIHYKLVAGNLPINQYSLGDVKTGFQTSDHNGWVKLDGRPKSNLSASQQTQANLLGIGVNLPDATNSFLVQNGSTIGSVSGSNNKTIAQSNLPNVTLSGTTGPDAGHTHTFPFASSAMNGAWGVTTNGGAGYNIPGNTTTTTSATHTHVFTTSSMNGGVTQTSLDITPKSLSVNTFIYLGY